MVNGISKSIYANISFLFHKTQDKHKLKKIQKSFNFESFLKQVQ